LFQAELIHWNTDLKPDAPQQQSSGGHTHEQWAEAWRKYKMAESISDAASARRELDRLERAN
jgi:hypothetical protein